MPQVHNKSLSQDTAAAFGKHSRYMATLRFTETSLRRVNAVNKLENRLTKKMVDFYERQTNIHNSKHERVKNRVIDNFHKRLAFKLVLRNHSVSEAKDPKKVLEEKFTFTALQNEVKQMIQFMRPERVRERKARGLIHEQQNVYDNIIFQNRQKFNRLFPEKITWMPRRHRELLELQKQEEENVQQPTPLPTRERKAKKSLALLRRRVISLSESKPNSPLKLPKSPALTAIKTPTISKPPSSNSRMTSKRQEISMSMMKRQKSFLEGKEKSIIAKEDIVDSMESKMKTLTLKYSTPEASQNKDLNNNDIFPNKIAERETSANSVKDRRESFLPPIETPVRGIGSSNLPKMTTQTDKTLKLPVLKMSKPVKIH